MRQRAALLRTLLFDTDVILLDEPFGALDAQTKLRMQEWLLPLWGDFGKTVVFVTHDVEEAIFLSDEVHVMGDAARAASSRRSRSPLPRPRLRACTLHAGIHRHEGALPRPVAQPGRHASLEEAA